MIALDQAHFAEAPVSLVEPQLIHLYCCATEVVSRFFFWDGGLAGAFFCGWGPQLFLIQPSDHQTQMNANLSMALLRGPSNDGAVQCGLTNPQRISLQNRTKRLQVNVREAFRHQSLRCVFVDHLNRYQCTEAMNKT